MDYRILYTKRALSDLAEIIGYIAEDDSDAASRFGCSLLDHIELLARFPHLGTMVRNTLLRKLIHSPVSAYYLVREDEHIVEVIHIRHGSRDLPRF